MGDLSRRGSSKKVGLRSWSDLPSLVSGTFGKKISEMNQLRNAMEDEERQGQLQKDPNRKAAFEQAIKRNDDQDRLRFHKDNVVKVCNQLETSVDTGITEEKAVEVRKIYGWNKLKEPETTPWIIKLLKEMTGVLCCLLWAGAALAFVAFGLTPEDYSNLYLGIVICLVVIITGFFAFYQNAQSEAIMAKFKDFIPQSATVMRNGKIRSIEAAELVPGDIITVGRGDKIPADIRLVEVKDMKVDNSSLTGESKPMARAVQSKEDSILRAENMAFFGTQCLDGVGKGIVVLTGSKTIIGSIAELASSAGEASNETTLQVDISRFMKAIAVIAVSFGLAFFLLGFIYGTGVIENLIYAIGIIVANVPEGLLITLTVCLAATAKKMSQKQALVKNLSSVETLGSISCICSDKTGTLTQNRMAPSKAYLCGKTYSCKMSLEDYDVAKKKGLRD